MSVEVSFLGSNPFRVSIVYASCKYLIRRELWQHLLSIVQPNIPWMVVGDLRSSLLRLKVQEELRRVFKQWKISLLSLIMHASLIVVLWTVDILGVTIIKIGSESGLELIVQ